MVGPHAKVRRVSVVVGSPFDHTFVLGRLANFRSDLGQVKVFEPQVLRTKVQFFDQFFLLRLCNQEMRDQTIESFKVLTVGLQGFLVILDGSFFVLKGLMSLC